MTEQVFQQIRQHPEVYRELDCTVCACGKKKGPGKSFCWGCWCALSTSLKRRLYEPIRVPGGGR